MATRLRVERQRKRDGNEYRHTIAIHAGYDGEINNGQDVDPCNHHHHDTLLLRADLVLLGERSSFLDQF